jgi:hypothetical protein
MPTQKNILDDINAILTRFKRTDEYRVPDLYLYQKINEVRGQLICQQYKDTNILDQNWHSNLGLVSFHSINAADDASIGYCGCNPLSKAYIPSLLTLPTKDVNQDLGIISLTSVCGKTKYNNRPVGQVDLIPEEHPYAMFGWYWRVNTAIYVNRAVEQLKFICILANPEEGFYIQSQSVLTGSIVLGTSYIVRGGQLVYDSVVYNDGDIFVGTATTTYIGAGKAYLLNQLMAYIETYPYPVNIDMARQIVLEICTKEFGIEKTEIQDIRNDSADDAQKS